MPFWEKGSFRYGKKNSVVNIHLNELEVPKNILNPTTKGYNE